MAWEQRGTHRYYYRSRKIAGRVVKEYVGGGLAGMLAQREDDSRRRKCESARAAFQADRDTFTAAATAHDELSRITDALMKAALVAAGYHRHDRGQWRKRHASKVER